MKVHLLLPVAAVALAIGPVSAQNIPRRADIRGGGNADRGKCTIEVVVDGVAEIEVRGDSAVLRNISGQPAQWRRFECNGPMPANMRDFRFDGVDGRGRQELLRDPRNGGVAVVRIEDPQSGAEGYTFDLFWDGGAGNPVTQDRNRPDNRNDYPRAAAPGRRFSADEAIGDCQQAVRQEAGQRFRTPNVVFRGTAFDNNRRDSILGTVEVRQGNNGSEMYRFSCLVDFDNSRIRSVQFDPADGGRRVESNGRGTNQALQTCQRAVEERLGQDGYGRIEFLSINVDNQPGRSDWIVGRARADSRNRTTGFDFSCSVNLDNGAVRTVDVRPARQ